MTKSFDRLEYALDDIRNDGARVLRTLRVQMPPTFAAHLAVPILRDFRHTAADVEIDLVSPYGVGPPLGEVDVAVVYSKPTVTEMVRDLLWPVRLSMICHPAIAARSTGQGARRSSSPRTNWSTCASRICRAIICGCSSRARPNLHGSNVERGLVFDTAMLAVQYALSGEGIALIDTYLFGDYIRTGRLVSPFRKSLDDGYGYYLITHPESLGDTAIALFRSWLIERFGNGQRRRRSNMRLAVSNDKRAGGIQ